MWILRTLHLLVLLCFLSGTLSGCYARRKPLWWDFTGSSSTAAIDGAYVGPCTSVSTDSMRLGFLIYNGTTSSVVYLYTGVSDCSGTASFVELGSNSPASDYVITGSMTFFSLPGTPPDFIIAQGTDLTNAVTFWIFHKADDQHFNLLMLDQSVAGSTWEQWLSTTADVAGFASDPAHFRPAGLNNYNLLIEKVRSPF